MEEEISLLDLWKLFLKHFKTIFFMTLLAIPIYTIIIVAFMKPFEKMNRDTMVANATLSSSIIEDINGI